jgi:hypothetical protein
MKLFGNKKSLEEQEQLIKKSLEEQEQLMREKIDLRHLEILAHPMSSLDIEVSRERSRFLRSAENVVLPLYSCIEFLRENNPRVNSLPDLFELSSNNLLISDTPSKKLIGAIAGHGIRMEIDAKSEEEVVSEMETNLFDIYCKCRQLMDVSKNFISPEQKAVLQSIVDRAEGDHFQEEYEKLLNPQTTTREEDHKVSTLILPDDYLQNPEFFDPSAPVIGALSDKVLKGGGQRFAIMIECLASNSFGYIKPSIGNKRLLAARLSGCKQESSYSAVEWIDKKGRSVSETEKVMLWLTNYLYGGGKYLSGGGYDRAYEVLNFERHVKPGQETANLKNADKVLRDRISLLYLNV